MIHLFNRSGICESIGMQDVLALARSRSPRPIIGMVHLRPLPGSPSFDGDFGRIVESALRDATALVDGGANAVMIENFGDTPFYKTIVPGHTVAHITAAALAIRDRIPSTPLGINVLRNDGCAAMGIAHAVGAAFIRVNVLVGARVTDQGVIEGIAANLLRLRDTLRADVRILADVNVKHSAPLGPYAIADEVADALERGGADAIIASGSGTGRATAIGEVRAVKEAAGDAPVFIGSGASIDTAAVLADAGADGFIVGTSLKTDGSVDPTKVRALVDCVCTLN